MVFGAAELLKMEPQGSEGNKARNPAREESPVTVHLAKLEK